MKIYEKDLGENYYLFAICGSEHLNQILVYINQVSNVWNTMVSIFGQKPYFKRYCVLLTDKTHKNEDYEGAFCLPGGLIFVKPDDAVIRGDPDFLWGGIIHEVLHAFLEPLKWFPGGQLDFRYQNFIDGGENNYEGFNLIVQKKLYSVLNKPELVERLLSEQAGNDFFNSLNEIVQDKGFEIVQDLFRRIMVGERFDKNLWNAGKTNKEILAHILLTS